MDINQALAAAVDVKVTTTTNADTVVTITAPTGQDAKGRVVFLYGVILSASAAPATPVVASVAGVTGQTINMEIPASAFAPIVLALNTHPMQCSAGVDLVVTLPALGSGVVGSVTVFYKILAA